MYRENDEERLGYFRKEPGHKYYLVHLFHEAEKVSEPNAGSWVCPPQVVQTLFQLHEIGALNNIYALALS